MSQTNLKKLGAAINLKYMLGVGIIATVLATLGALATSARDTDILNVTSGIALFEFRGYESWQLVSMSENNGLAVWIPANPRMVKPFTDGTKVAKIHWSPKEMATLPSATSPGTQRDVERARAEGLAAWQEVYSVLTYPRCINCHTATDHPDQGDDRHRHVFNVVRGPDGKGVPGLNCVTCHQGANSDTGVPGAPGWHLAPLSMRWQDSSGQIFSSAQVCKSLTDRSKNGNLSGSSLLKHHKDAPLVLWAFEPGRIPYGNTSSRPPLTHEQFVKATRIWVEAGTPCPVEAGAVKNLTP